MYPPAVAVSNARPWLLLCKPVRAPFRDGTSVLVRNMLMAMPSEVEVVYFGDPDAAVRTAGDRVIAATSMAYQPSLANKMKMLAHIAMPQMSKLPIHSFFAPNRGSATALEVVRRFPRSRAVLQTLPASTGCASVANLLARLDRVVVTSDWGRNQLLAQGLAEDRVARVYPGVEILAEAPGPAIEQRRSILFAGDLDEEVGDRLIDVAASLADAEEWRLEIATRPKGEGHERVKRRLDQELAPAVAAGRVSFLGEVSSMNELFDRAALQLYLASHARKKVDIPFVLIEGLARGVPVAVVDAAPVGELLTLGRKQDLEVGLSLDPKDFRESAREIPALIHDTARMQRLGRAAQQLAAERFSATEMAAAYRQHYEDLS